MAENQDSTTGAAPDGVATEQIARQAAAFLAAAVHGEVDDARVGATHVLATADRGHVYAVAVAQGPLRSYVATAWGPAGNANLRGIVAYPDVAAAQAAFDAALIRKARDGYQPWETVDGES